MSTILCTTSSFGKENPDILELLRGKSLTPRLNPFGRKLAEKELQELVLQHRPIALLAGTESISRSTLEQARQQLKLISRVGVGWDNVDHVAARDFGIKVYRTEGALDQAVAELTIGFILNALRNISLHDRQIRNSIWQKKMGALFNGKKLGIIGYGSIGQKVGELANSFGAKVIYSDICKKESSCAICVPPADLLKQADIISIHAAGCELILGEKELASCQKGTIIVNTARGELIDEDALYNFLADGHIAYACLDVFANEPYTGPLSRLDNVILTSHIGSYAREARVRMEAMAVANLLHGLHECSIL